MNCKFKDLVTFYIRINVCFFRIKKTKKTVLPTKKSKTINKAKPGSLKERIENLKKK